MKKNLFLFIFCLILLFPLCFLPFAEINENVFALQVLEIDSKDYTAGTWTNKDVELELTQGFANYYYSTGESWILMDSNKLIISEEYDGDYNFRACDSRQVFSEEVSINIKIDKTAPTNLSVFYNDNYTNQNIQLIVLAEDRLSGIGGYSVFENDFVNNNLFSITNNTVFELGSIRVVDNAGNMAVLDRVVIIDKIDKNKINFSVNYDDDNIEKQKILEINIVEPISKIKSVKIVFDNSTQDITSTYKSGFKITQNGKYQIVVENGVGRIDTKTIEIKNIGVVFPLQMQILILLCELFLSLAMLLDIIRRKNSKKTTKKST